MSHSKRNLQIAPSLLASDLSRLGEEIRALEAGGADLLHFDIMDGHFVPNITWGFPLIRSVRKVTQLAFDAHLMISNADRYLEEFAEAGCNWVSVHVEACPHLHRTLARIRELGMKPGIAINPGTSLSNLDAALGDAHHILVMSVDPGFGGQKFIPASLNRLQELKKMIGHRDIRIQIDGGIKTENIAEVVEYGADTLVVGTGLFVGGSENYAKNIQALRTAAQTSIKGHA